MMTVRKSLGKKKINDCRDGHSLVGVSVSVIPLRTRYSYYDQIWSTALTFERADTDLVVATESDSKASAKQIKVWA